MLGFAKNQHRKEALATINITNQSINQAKSIIDSQQSKTGLPFQDMLSSDPIQRHIAEIPCRDRIFTPDVTLYTFLSQVISSDQSCQAAVAQLLAHFTMQGKDISANTAAYCDARKRSPEKMLSSLVQESAEQLEAQANDKWSWRGRSVQ